LLRISLFSVLKNVFGSGLPHLPDAQWKLGAKINRWEGYKNLGDFSKTMNHELADLSPMVEKLVCFEAKCTVDLAISNSGSYRVLGVMVSHIDKAIPGTGFP